MPYWNLEYFTLINLIKMNNEQNLNTGTSASMDTKPLVSGSACVHCGSTKTRVEKELGYNDGTDEPSTSNWLVEYSYGVCDECGDTF